MHEGVGRAEGPGLRNDFLGEGRDLWRLLAHRRPRRADGLASEPASRRRGPVRAADPGGLALRLVAGRFEEARAALAARLASGAAFSSLMLRDIAPAARRLGDFWAEDSCDFFDVTRAAGDLGDLLRDFSPDEEALADAPSIVVAPAPGETHRLGVEIVARMFRLAGWRAVCCAAHELCATLAGERFDVAGVSLGCDRFAAALPDAIAAARAASRNSRLAIVLGGAAIAAEPKLGAGIDAEFCVGDRDMAVNFPNSLLRAFPL
jgi:methylmalonyl-CoA mutase cobalamin-binding subunit